MKKSTKGHETSWSEMVLRGGTQVEKHGFVLSRPSNTSNSRPQRRNHDPGYFTRNIIQPKGIELPKDVHPKTHLQNLYSIPQVTTASCRNVMEGLVVRKEH